MKLKVVILILIIIAALIFSVDMIYDKTLVQQNHQQTTHKVLNKLPTKELKDNDISVVNGFDWSLANNTKPSPYSGLIAESESKSKIIPHKFLMVLWNQSNPQKGVYNFGEFERQLNQLKGKALVRLEVNSSCEAPAWALKSLRSSKDKSLIFWDKNYLSYLDDFVSAFAKRYASSSKIVGVHLGIGDGEFSGSCNDYDNKDGWGEFWMSPAVIAEAQTNFGLTPDIFENSSKEIIKIYATAFGKYKSKLAYTNLGPLFSWEEIATPYNKRLVKLAKFAINSGVGNRDGDIEQWMRFLDKNYGVEITSMADGTCRLDFNEEYANKIRGRYWGTENEFYGDKDYVIGRHGNYKNQAYRFMVSSLRALQMRRNFITTSDSASMMKIKHADYKTQDFLSYLTKVLGKQMENTPDAFILLGERYISASHAEANRLNEACVTSNGDEIPFRSFGRWLTDTGNSKPAIKVKMPKTENHWAQDYYLPETIDFEYAARQAKQLTFDLNDQLAKKRCAKGCNTEIKVTFKDTVKTTMKIMVEEGYTKALQTLGDNKIKTATFKVKSIFKNGVSGSDFIVQSDKNPIPVMMIRVNFK